MNILKLLLPLFTLVKKVSSVAVTPLLEKNVVKLLAHDSPLVLSMSRSIACTFAVVMLKQIWHAGINGWPDASVAIATVLALPLMTSIERADPTEVLALCRVIMARFKTSSEPAG